MEKTERLLNTQPNDDISRDSQRMRAVVLMLQGSAVCVVVNSFVGHVNVSLVALVQGRYFIQWLIGFAGLLLRSKMQNVDFHPFGPPGQRLWLILRAFVYYAFIWLWWTTLTLVPVGDAVAIVKFEVFVCGIMSSMLFGERLSGRWWLCCCASIMGVIMVVRPPAIFGGDDSASLYGRCMNLLTPLVAGIMPCLIKLAPDAHFLEVQHACDFFCGLIFAPPTMMLASEAYGSLLQPRTSVAIVVVSILGMVALCSFTLAYQKGEAGRISLIGYSEVPISYIVQVFVFGTTLEIVPVAGALLIVLSAAVSSMERQKGNGLASAASFSDVDNVVVRQLSA